eukprot:CAMPEP_0180762092 /NCGR_PEP_ID=MMETSP1038_2-20121128/37188_1 /TAXON_ID=632150 /ORGANISM="Azadinium spinosum, Strain 3D9" /LENGTH=77 /DNA_ID=CAMNT_0022796335 /DNA_START=152 /DNA_END=385 /DNA_ORIENTATION=+
MATIGSVVEPNIDEEREPLPRLPWLRDRTMEELAIEDDMFSHTRVAEQSVADGARKAVARSPRVAPIDDQCRRPAIG